MLGIFEKVNNDALAKHPNKLFSADTLTLSLENFSGLFIRVKLQGCKNQ